MLVCYNVSILRNDDSRTTSYFLGWLVVIALTKGDNICVLSSIILDLICTTASRDFSAAYVKSVCKLDFCLEVTKKDVFANPII